MARNGAGSREKVVEAAMGLFLHQGYQATSMDQILESAGVSPSNFYYHFKGKEELALEVIEQYMQSIREETKPALGDPESPPSEKLRLLYRYFLDFMQKNDCCGGCPLGNLAQELSDTHPPFRRRLAEYFRQSVDNTTELIREGIRRGEFRRDIDPKAVAYMIFGSMEGLLLLCKNLKQIEPLELGFEAVLKAIQAGREP